MAIAGISPQILGQNWPVFFWGRWVQNPAVRTQMVDVHYPIEIGQVTIRRWAFLFGDVDGRGS